MRFRVFEHDANPAIDKPSFKLSEARGLEMLALKEAIRLSERDLQKVPRRSSSHLDTDSHDGRPCQMTDWITRDLSFLPKELWESCGHILRITTKQLQVPE